LNRGFEVHSTNLPPKKFSLSGEQDMDEPAANWPALLIFLVAIAGVFVAIAAVLQLVAIRREKRVDALMQRVWLEGEMTLRTDERERADLARRLQRFGVQNGGDDHAAQ
jgi:hypothetical protein